MHRAKGLEFNAVAIPFLSKAAFPPLAALRAAVDKVDCRNILQQQKALLAARIIVGGWCEDAQDVSPRTVSWLREPVQLPNSSSRQSTGVFHFTYMDHERRVTPAFNFVELPASLNFSSDIRL